MKKTQQSMVPRRIRFSPKRAALAKAFGRPWASVALEYDAREDLRLQDIADQWTRVVGPIDAGVRFTAQDVSDILRLARHLRVQQSPVAEPPADLAGAAK